MSTRDIPHRILLGPGPSLVSPEVLQAMGRSLLGYLDPALFAILDEIQIGLRALFGTRNEVTLALPGTGMSGMQCALSNLLEPGDRVLVIVNGFFGGRMVEIARRQGAVVHTLEVPWGEAPSAEGLQQALDEHDDWSLVGLVHAETSTGVVSPVAELAPLVRASGALFLLDTVTSLGGLPVEIDAWGVDAAYSATQKCVGCPPGLAPITLGPRAWARIEERERPPASWYLDLRLLMDYWSGPRLYHHTAPVSMIYGLAQALSEIAGEGLGARYARHLDNANRLVEGLDHLGLSVRVPAAHRLPTLTPVSIPEGVDDAAVRRSLLLEDGIEIGGGLGAWKGQVWRIGLMGYSSRSEYVDRLLGALQRRLQH